MLSTHTKINFATLHFLFCTIFGNEKSAIIVNLRLQNATEYHFWRFIFTNNVGFPHFMFFIYMEDTYLVNNYD